MLSLNVPVPRFLSAGEVFAGEGSVAVLRALPAARVAVVASPSLLNAPAGDLLRRSVKALATHVIAAPGTEPSLAGLTPLIGELAEFQPDWIVAAGGGSVIDSAKIAWVFHEHPNTELDRLMRPFGLPPMRGRAKFAALPTTAGAGSEVSSAAIFDAGPGTGKRPIVSHELLPDLAILDPALARDVPTGATIAAGLDALSHAIESYASRFENALVDMMAEQASRTLFADLPIIVRDPSDAAARLRLMQAAMMAGWAQNLKVPGVGHALAHQLGAYGLAHGEATGALLAPATRFNCFDPAVLAKYDHLGLALGLGDAGGLIAAIEHLRDELGAETPRIAVQSHDKPALFAAALQDICARANPRDLNEAALDTILSDTFGQCGATEPAALDGG